MPVAKILLYSSREPVKSTLPEYGAFVRNAAILGAKRVFHYQAIPDGFKNIEPNLVLCSFSTSEDAQSAPPDSGSLKSLVRVPVPEINDMSHLENDSSTTTAATASNSGPQSSPPECRTVRDDLPQGDAKQMVFWSDDDIDAVDYKNYPDYDPDQEESVYESTDLESDLEVREKPDKGRRLAEISGVQSYAELDSKPSGKDFTEEEISAKCLLVLFIPAPLTAVDPDLVPPTPSSLTPSQTIHANFLAHLHRYPYLTSHENYIRHTGYVLEPRPVKQTTTAEPPASPIMPLPAAASTQYLIVEEFSEMERSRSRSGRIVGMNWELKRKEAKHWWRKEERGSSGVTAGFFELVDEEKIG
ncbi:MAG: hypothetical protein Q9167_006047 [Letrouitia subvulpina]